MTQSRKTDSGDDCLPAARKANLIVQKLADELLIYDLDQHRAHCLNQSAALVWKYCDGKTRAASVVERVRDELQLALDQDAVWLAVGQFHKRGLLESTPRPAYKPKVNRRALMLRLGAAAIIGVPLVRTIVAPQAAQAATCAPCVPPTTECCMAGCPCTMSAQCCSGVCSSGSCA